MIQTAHILVFFLFLISGCLKNVSNHWNESSATKDAMFLPHALMPGKASSLLLRGQER